MVYCPPVTALSHVCVYGTAPRVCSFPCRRLLLFKYDGLEFVEQREVSLPDAAACMQLAGSTLYVGLAKRCGLGAGAAWASPAGVSLVYGSCYHTCGPVFG